MIYLENYFLKYLINKPPEILRYVTHAVILPSYVIMRKRERGEKSRWGIHRSTLFQLKLDKFYLAVSSLNKTIFLEILRLRSRMTTRKIVAVKDLGEYNVKF